MRWLFYKVEPPQAPNTREWGDLLREILENPLRFAQEYLLWIIAFLVLLYLLQRLNNILEVQGVNRAIFLSRAAVGTLTAFIITPAVFVLFINVVALANGLPTINLMRIWDWIQLTLTSYWWLVRCFFNSADIPVMTELYDGNSLVRILWITVPLSAIWLYTSDTAMMRWMLLPLLVLILFVTRHRVANETFLTDMLEPHFPAWFTEKKGSPLARAGEQPPQESPTQDSVLTVDSPVDIPQQEDLDRFYQANRHLLNLAVLGLFVVGLVTGLVFKKTFAGSMLAVAAIGLFFVFDKGQAFSWHPSGKSGYQRQAELDNLMHKFVEEARRPDADSVLLSLLSIKINKTLLEEKQSPPDSICTEFPDYFAETCAGQ